MKSFIGKRLIFAALSCFFLLSLIFSGPIVNAHHAVLRVNLEEMIAGSSRIFIGTCVDARETYEHFAQGSAPVTVYTFKVSEVIKGDVPTIFTFKQRGHRSRQGKPRRGDVIIGGRVANPTTYFHGLSEYEVGDEVLLMLNPFAQSGDKLTSPVGLYQGAFYVSTMPSGKKMLRNSINNQGLFTAPFLGIHRSAAQAKFIRPGDSKAPIYSLSLKGTTPSSLVSKRGALPMDAFVNLVKQMVAAERVT